MSPNARLARAQQLHELRLKSARDLSRVVQRLTDEQRTKELARMLGGARITTSVRAHAQQLIEEAQRERKPQRAATSANKRTKRP